MKSFMTSSRLCFSVDAFFIGNFRKEEEISKRFNEILIHSSCQTLELSNHCGRIDQFFFEKLIINLLAQSNLDIAKQNIGLF